MNKMYYNVAYLYGLHIPITCVQYVCTHCALGVLRLLTQTGIWSPIARIER